MLTLIDRTFTVNAPLEKAWQHLARVDQWPTWAPHIKHIEIHPAGELGSKSSGVILLANGIKSRFRMTEFNPGRNWKWVGPFLWLTIHYDHLFEAINNKQTKLRFVVEANGFGVNVFGRVFATIYRRNLERAIPLLVSQMEN
jgi:Polyketide cyclase / dehydrase and lipid transport